MPQINTDLIMLDSMSKETMREYFAEIGFEKFRADQIFDWIHNKRVLDFEQMTNLSKKLREKLTAECGFTRFEVIKEQRSMQDDSMKLLFRLSDGNMIEAVTLRDFDRATGCISTQVGCRMGCAFCSTAKMGFIRNLTVGEILLQVRTMDNMLRSEGRRLTNLVFMGMGEPLDNLENLLPAITVLLDDNGYGFSYRRITVSTSGLTDKLPKLFELDKPVNLAVSINAPTQAKREQIMPISRKFPLDELMRVVRSLPVSKHKMIMIEYVLLKGFNDSEEDARAFAKLIRGMPVKVNLIAYNSSKDGEFRSSGEKETLKFQQYLIQERIGTFIRKSLGSDIDGACGQLYAKTAKEKGDDNG
ncbi:MAG: 23S rRNA (adenine(2503)-C(2))-methyltransferase RlmN [Deferribacterales bacterium]